MENSTEDVEVRSIDVRHDVGRNEHLEHALQEHYVLKQAVNLWQGPKYPGYCSIIKRVRSFDNWDWPETKPTPVSLAGAGLFYDGESTAFNRFLLYMQGKSLFLFFTCNRLKSADRMFSLWRWSSELGF
jgi:hypothetical protein